MPISNKQLLDLSSAATLGRGTAYAHEGRVGDIRRSGNDIYACVEGTGTEPYDVSVRLNQKEDKLLACSCTCPAYYGGNEQICKHIVAVLLQMRDLATRPYQPQSDYDARRVLDNYVRNEVDLAAKALGGQAKLEPTLHYGASGEMHLSFRVGEDRMYVLPDLPLFAMRLCNRTRASYGRFELWHSPASFCPASQPLVAFFMRRYNDNSSFHANSPYSIHTMSGRDKRIMPLAPAMAEELFAMLEGETLLVQGSAGASRAVRVVREDPRPRLALQKTESGAKLSAPLPGALLPGDTHCFLLTQDRLFICSAAFKDACADLLLPLYHKDSQLFFAQKDLPRLLVSVLPRVEPFVDLETEGDFEALRPPPLRTRVYLDSPAPNALTALMTFTYGDETFPAFSDKRHSAFEDIAGEMAAELLLDGYFEHNTDEAGTRAIVDDPDAVYRLVAEGLDALAKVGEVYTSEAVARYRLHPPARVALGVRVDAGLLDMDIHLEGLDHAELAQVLAAYRARKKYHRLRDGSFLTLEDTALAGLSELAEGLDLSEKQLSAGHAQLPASRAPYLDAVRRGNEELHFDRDRGFRQILRDLGEVENADYALPKSLDKVLRNYQKTGFLWLKTLAEWGFGGILADDMGLGKTLQVLALLQSGLEGGESLPSLVVCPSSLCLNWESEAQKFTPELKTLVVAGTAAERARLLEGAADQDLVITSYDALKRDLPHYEDLRFAYIVIDEAQYIKNQSTRNAKSVKALNGKVRFALTGTPVENSLAELWSIFDFLMPGYLFSYSRFKKKYEEPIVKKQDADTAGRLRRLVRPFLLRRLKSEVLRELPPKTETVLRAPLEGEQKKIYAATLAAARQELGDDPNRVPSRRMAILAALTRLRQICCDPALLYENYNGPSPKLEACMDLVQSAAASGHRMLLFSQFTSMLNILQGRLDALGLAWTRIDGSTKPGIRLDLVNRFNAGDTPIFLISLKAGGTGLNLTGADVVIHYDPWWNLSAQNQATDRAHRIGQKNHVQVYKLIAKATIEERILDLQRRKADLADQVIEQNEDPFTLLSAGELLALLEEGDNG